MGAALQSVRPGGFESLIDSIMEKIIFSAPLKQQAPVLSGYGNLERCDFLLLNEMTLGDDWQVLVADAKGNAEAQWPIDVSMVNRREEEGYSLLMRVATVFPADVRGSVRMCPPKMVAIVCCWIYDTGKCASETRIAGLVGGRWVDIEHAQVTTRGGHMWRKTHEDQRMAEEVHNSVWMATAAALTMRYSWHVAVGFDDGPRLLLATDPQGVRALLKDREVSEGAARRAAMRNWVREHFRQHRVEADALTYVREHLRGSTRCRWYGYDCEVLVSAFDLERNEWLGRQAADWRAARQHNRVRLRVKRR